MVGVPKGTDGPETKLHVEDLLVVKPDRKSWSFTVPYQRRPGEYKPVYPDFLFFRQPTGRIVIDILDPHGSHLDDAVTKAKGLALYAKEH